MKISIQNLTTGYGDNTIIRSLFLDIPLGSFVAVVGHNGSGKSTFLKSISNKIQFDGEIIFPNPKPSIAILSQKNQVNFSISVKDLVAMGLFNKNKLFQVNSSKNEIEVLAALAQNNISHLAEKDFLTLSGGEQQLVWLSQMLLQNTDIYLFDEPTQYLDISHTNKVFELMQNMVYNKNKTVICITHHIHYLKNTQGYILNLSNKKLELVTITNESIINIIDSLSQ